MIPERETVREHLRNALQGMDLLNEALEDEIPLERIRARVATALAVIEQIAAEAATHPFSWARSVRERL